MRIATVQSINCKNKFEIHTFSHFGFFPFRNKKFQLNFQTKWNFFFLSIVVNKFGKYYEEWRRKKTEFRYLMSSLTFIQIATCTSQSGNYLLAHVFFLWIEKTKSWIKYKKKKRKTNQQKNTDAVSKLQLIYFQQMNCVAVRRWLWKKAKKIDYRYLLYASLWWCENKIWIHVRKFVPWNEQVRDFDFNFDYATSNAQVNNATKKSKKIEHPSSNSDSFLNNSTFRICLSSCV